MSQRNPQIKGPEQPTDTPEEGVTMLEKWDGEVISVEASEFTTILRNGRSGDVEAVFDIEEVSPADRDLVAPGALFDFSVFYRDRRGTRVRASMIRFRRFPEWSEKDLESAAVEADAIADALGWK